MAFNAEILLFLLPQILDTAAGMIAPCYGSNQSGTNTACAVAVNETVCLICLTSKTDRNAVWLLGHDKLYQYTIGIQLNNVPGKESPDNYDIGCNDRHYSLKVFRRHKPGYSTVYFCQASGNLSYGFNVTTVEETATMKSEEHLNGSNGTNSDTSIPSGILALFFSVPCLFIVPILTSVILYFKAKNYRQRKLERRKSVNVGGAAVQSETNYRGTVLVCADIIEEEKKHTEDFGSKTTKGTLQNDIPMSTFEDLSIKRNQATLSRCCETTLNTRLKTSGIFEYWSATYIAETSEDQTCFAKTLSSLATIKDARAFQELAMNLKALTTSNFVVQLLCASVDKIPYCIYYVYMECGSLRDFMLRRYQQARKSRMSLSIGNPEILPTNVKSQIEELLTFASMIAEALKFITSKNFSHPALSLKKVLLSEYCECKLYDIYPTEMAMTRVNYLMTKDDPPIAWMAVETIFLQEYQTGSDVWSFAVLLWELFSLGEEPLARNSREEVEHKIREGVALTQPLCCPDAMYGIMLSCWNNTARNRPTFESLLHKIRDMVEKFKGLATVSEVPEMQYFVLDPNEEQNNYT